MKEELEKKELAPEAEEAEPRIGKRAAESVLIGIEQGTRAFDIGTCLPFVRAPQLERQRLGCSEGVSLGEGEAGSWSYLTACLARKVALELSIIGFVERGIDNDVEGVIGH